jgi:nitric oxide reductase subunit C
MSKRQAAYFFFIVTGVFLLLFIVLTVDSHRRFPALTNAEQIDASVLAGQDVWHGKNCVNCHTLLGEGAYFAPDLTKITSLRGSAYLTSFLQEPSRFYTEERDGRVMTNPGLSEAQIRDVIAFLGWISRIDNQNWPPRPILVSGSALSGVFTRGVQRPEAASDDPVELGEQLFAAVPPGCVACHSTAPGVVLVGPSLAGIATRAAETVRTEAYTGSATTAEAYIRESILQPSAYIVPGQPTFQAAGRSIMPEDYGTTLTEEQVDHLVAYLMTLR